MPSADIITETAVPAANPTSPAPLLISLSSLSRDALDRTLANLAAAFPSQNLVVATPDASAKSSGSLTLLNYESASHSAWLLTAADFLNAYKLAATHHTAACLLLGPEAQSLSIEALRSLAAAVTSGHDLALPCYQLRARDGLVNSAILYPVTRALFGLRVRFPLAIDLGLSLRMVERLAAPAQKFTSANQSDALLWPVAEAAIGNCSIAEIPAGPRTLPHPADADLNTLLGLIAGSLFADIDAKAAFWQRVRIPHSSTHPGDPSSAKELSRLSSHDITEGRSDSKVGGSATTSEEDIRSVIAPMLDSFCLAYTNLHEIWALVLPPNALLGLKKLSLLSPENFRFPDALWVRIVYDFLLAYHLRTLNRSHLLGALTPLYLAWAASHLNLTASGLAPEQHIEQLATVFETDKPYLVSRWRWPDRFNP